MMRFLLAFILTFLANAHLIKQTLVEAQSISKEKTICKPGHRLNKLSICEPCPVGHFLDTREDECKPCPQHTYQDTVAQTECIKCGDGYRTDGSGSVHKSMCKFFCTSGSEKVPNIEEDECRLCERSTYRNNTVHGYYGQCIQCPKQLLTRGDGARDKSACILRNCDPGHHSSPDLQSCVPCELGHYQSSWYTTSCYRCPDGTSTKHTGSLSITQCVPYCASGEEMVEGACIKCKRGYYKDNGLGLYSTCTPCPNKAFITVSVGATSRDDCTIADCSAGSRLTEKNTCELCKRGTYQPQPRMDKCITCPVNKTSRYEGSTMADDCKAFTDPPCAHGYGYTGGLCVACGDGFFKELIGNISCLACPPGYRTGTLGATKSSDCNIRACDPGTAGVSCEPCAYGMYQPDRWQAACIACPVGFTTRRTASSALVDCFRICPPGESDHGDGHCILCERGSYKERRDGFPCVRCPEGFTTSATGASHKRNCDFLPCEPGHMFSRPTKTCTPCDYGWYQPKRAQPVCLRCPNDKTTLTKGATRINQCVKNCKEGTGYKETRQQCEPCILGYYRNGSPESRNLCVPCPSEFTTATIGSTNEQECIVRKCTNPGQYRHILKNACLDCPVGTYQDTPQQTSCNGCPAGQTTRTNRSVNKADCVHFCDTDWCLNSGKCDKSRKENLCTCVDRYAGDRCEFLASVGAQEETVVVGAAVGVGGFVLFAILILAFVFSKIRKSRRESKEAIYESRKDEVTDAYFTQPVFMATSAYTWSERMATGQMSGADIPDDGRIEIRGERAANNLGQDLYMTYNNQEISQAAFL